MGLFDKPTAPTPPNPKTVSQASTGGAYTTAVANTHLGNMNQVNPYGSLTYSYTGGGGGGGRNATTGGGGGGRDGGNGGRNGGNGGNGGRNGSSGFTGFTGFTGGNGNGGRNGGGRNGNVSVTDPYTDQKYKIPTFTATTTLTDEQQAIFDTNQANQRLFGTKAGDQLRNLSGMERFTGDAGLDLSLAGADNFSADRQRYEDALMARMQPQLSQDQDALNTSLANQGLSIGGEAYSDAQFDLSRAKNDARMSAILAGGEEQQRMFDMDLAASTFGNNSKQQTLSNKNNATTGNNANRTATMSEIMRMITAAQPNVPNFTPNTPSQIPTTDNAGIINNSYNQNQANYQQELASWNNTWGNIFGLGTAAVGAPR